MAICEKWGAGKFVGTKNHQCILPISLTPTGQPALWQVIKDLLADQRKREHELRNVFNALFYVVKGGISLRQMPNDLPPGKIGYYYFRKFQRLGIWQELNDALREKIRLKAG